MSERTADSVGEKKKRPSASEMTLDGPLTFNPGDESKYTERYLAYVKEANWGQDPGSGYEGITFALTFEGRVDYNVVDDDIIGTGARDQGVRTRRQKAVTGTFTHYPLTGHFFEYILGSYTSTAAKHICIGAKVLPSFTLYKGVRDPQEETVYLGCKIDRAELNLNIEDVAECRCDFAAQDMEYDSGWNAPTVNINRKPYVFCEGRLIKGGSTISGLQSATIEIRNNLRARFSCDETRTKPECCKEIREGRLACRGSFTIDEDVLDFIKDSRSGTEFSLQLRLVHISGTEEMNIFINNAQIGEIGEGLEGQEPYEVEIPFVCRPSAEYSMVWVEYNSTYPTEV